MLALYLFLLPLLLIKACIEEFTLKESRKRDLPFEIYLNYYHILFRVLMREPRVDAITAVTFN